MWLVPLALACLADSTCRPRAANAVEVLDLLKALPRAERRGPAEFGEPAKAAADGFGTDLRPSIVVVVPSRITWRGLRFAPGSLQRTTVGARPLASSTKVLFRIGISDERSYEDLARQVVDTDTPGWTDMRLDLSRYGGWQWSVFYHPDRHCWNLIFNVSASGGALPGVAGLWALPAVYTAPDAQRELLRSPSRAACP